MRGEWERRSAVHPCFARSAAYRLRPLQMSRTLDCRSWLACLVVGSPALLGPDKDINQTISDSALKLNTHGTVHKLS